MVESSPDAEKRGAFDFSRSAIQQLYDRVDALGALPRENLLIALIRDRLGEFNCLAICNSGFGEPRSVTGTTCGKALGEDIVSLSTPKAAYIAALILTLIVAPTFTSSGSGLAEKD